jgi:phosphoglucomutase
MAAMMNRLRSTPPSAIGGSKVVLAGDYLAQTISTFPDRKISSTGLPASDVLYFSTALGDTIVVRPSGTEPKIKVYYMLSGKNAEETESKLALYRADMDAVMEA